MKSVKNYSTPKKVCFNISECADGISCNLKNLGLHKYIYTSNMVLFTEKGAIKLQEALKKVEITDNEFFSRIEKDKHFNGTLSKLISSNSES